MTRIKRLVVHGFKSFARRTEFVFDSNYNVVLGPNGSGKSNVLDSLCFVLGKSSSKSLRAEKAANLIYNGGKKKKPAKEAEVSIFFDNTSKIFPLEEDEVKVSRIVKSSGQSVYKVNNKRWTRGQIIDLLATAKINPDGYNIILQGDIQRFVEMPATHRRELIEEIAGLSVYEEKKNKAVRELDKVDVKLQEAELILGERELQLKDLKGDRDQAVKYIDKKKQLETSTATHLKKQIERQHQLMENVNKRMEKQNERYQELMKEMTDVRGVIEDKKNKINDINKEIEEKGSEEQKLMQIKVNQLSIDITKAQERRSTCEEEIKRVGNRRKALESELGDIENKIKLSETSRNQNASDLEETDKGIKVIKERIDVFRKDNELDNEVAIQDDITKLDNNVETSNDKVQKLQEEKQELMREHVKLETEMQVIDEKIEKVEALAVENKVQIQDLKDKQVRFKKVTLELAETLNENSNLSAQIKNARDTLHDAQGRLSTLRAKVQDIHQRSAGSKGISAIMELKKSGEIRGIRGTVSELGQADDKFSMALSVAAGGKIKSIVVEDDKTAGECIKYLKANKLGVVSFLPMNKIRSHPISAELHSLAKSKGVHGLAQNLVTYDHEYKSIFSYVFGDTLIVNDIDTARDIGINKVKMATLTGDVTKKSGAMVGGHRGDKPAMAFIEKETTEQLQRYEKIEDDNMTVLNSLEKKKEDSEEEIGQLRESKADLEGDIVKLQKILNIEADDIGVTKDEKGNKKKRMAEIESKLEELNESITEINMDLAKNRSEKEALRYKVSQLKDPKVIAELTAFQEELKNLEQKKIRLESDAKHIGEEIKNAYGPQIENGKKALEQSAKDEESLKKEVEEKESMIKELQAELDEKKKVINESYDKFKEYYNQRDSLNDEIKTEEEKLNEFQGTQIRWEQNAGKANAERGLIETETETLTRQYEEYQNVEIDPEDSRTIEQLDKEINKIQVEMENMGDINMKALHTYEQVEKTYNELIEKRTKLMSEKEDVLILMNEIEMKKGDLFLKTFDVVKEQFKGVFALLSSKGDATLVLEDPEHPFEGGVLIKVKLKGNKYMDIRSLSGGEKTLTALAFIFAIQEHDPASFYVLDEVDAALDKHNSDKLAKLIKQYSSKAQYVMISHNDNIISEGNTLYGISMDEHGMSQVVSLKI